MAAAAQRRGAVRNRRKRIVAAVAAGRLGNVIALMRHRDVGEVRQEWLVVAVNAVTEQIVRALVGESERTMQDWTVPLGDGAQLDVHDIVFEATAVREAREVASED